MGLGCKTVDAFVWHDDGNPEFEFKLPANRRRVYEPGQGSNGERNLTVHDIGTVRRKMWSDTEGRQVRSRKPVGMLHGL